MSMRRKGRMAMVSWFIGKWLIGKWLTGKWLTGNRNTRYGSRLRRCSSTSPWQSSSLPARCRQRQCHCWKVKRPMHGTLPGWRPQSGIDCCRNIAWRFVPRLTWWGQLRDQRLHQVPGQTPSSHYRVAEPLSWPAAQTPAHHKIDRHRQSSSRWSTYFRPTGNRAIRCRPQLQTSRSRPFEHHCFSGW